MTTQPAGGGTPQTRWIQAPQWAASSQWFVSGLPPGIHPSPYLRRYSVNICSSCKLPLAGHVEEELSRIKYGTAFCRGCYQNEQRIAVRELNEDPKLDERLLRVVKQRDDYFKEIRALNGDLMHARSEISSISHELNELSEKFYAEPSVEDAVTQARLLVMSLAHTNWRLTPSQGETLGKCNERWKNLSRQLEVLGGIMELLEQGLAGHPIGPVGWLLSEQPDEGNEVPDKQPEKIAYRDGTFWDQSQSESSMIDLTTPVGQNIQQAATTQFGDLSSIEGQEFTWDSNRGELISMSSGTSS